MKFLVTGGAGFIGSHVVDRVVAEGHEVVVYDNFDDYYHGKERNIAHHRDNPKFHLRPRDILDFDPLLESMKECDIVVHLAAQPGVRYSLENPHKTNRVNITGTLNVLDAARRVKPRRILVASSSSVYGPQETTPVREEAPTQPLSIYGASKLAVENYSTVYMKAYDLPVTILRFHTVYGPRQRPDMAIAKWFHTLKQGKNPVIYGDGTQRRDCTYVQDVVEAVWLALTKKGVDGEIINVGSGTPVTIMRLLDLISKATNTPANPIFEQPRVYEPSETHADLRKAEKLLAYRPRVAIEQGISLYYEWLVSQGQVKKVEAE